MPRLRKFRLSITYDGKVYDEGMDQVVKDIVGGSLTWTGSGMDIVEEVRDMTYVGTLNTVVCAVDKLMRNRKIKSIHIYPEKA